MRKKKGRTQTCNINQVPSWIPKENPEYQTESRGKWDQNINRIRFKDAIPNDTQREQEVMYQHLKTEHYKELQQASQRCASEYMALHAAAENQQMANGYNHSLLTDTIRKCLITHDELLGTIQESPFAPSINVKIMIMHEKYAITDGSYFNKWIFCSRPPKSLIAKIFISVSSFSKSALKTNLPILPKPLMPIFNNFFLLLNI